jgi:hypothetical protein
VFDLAPTPLPPWTMKMSIGVVIELGMYHSGGPKVSPAVALCASSVEVVHPLSAADLRVIVHCLCCAYILSVTQRGSASVLSSVSIRPTSSLLEVQH